jgi:hypothetical protein
VAALVPAARVEVKGPASYPGALPYLATVELTSTEARDTVTARVHCEGVLLPRGTSEEISLPPGQASVFFFLIPPGHSPLCAVTVAGQDCGRWTIAPSGDGNVEQAVLTCAAMAPNEG